MCIYLCDWIHIRTEFPVLYGDLSYKKDESPKKAKRKMLHAFWREVASSRLPCKITRAP